MSRGSPRSGRSSDSRHLKINAALRSTGGKSRLVESLRDTAASQQRQRNCACSALHTPGLYAPARCGFPNDYLQLGRTMQDANILQILRALVAELKLEDECSVALIAR